MVKKKNIFVRHIRKADTCEVDKFCTHKVDAYGVDSYGVDSYGVDISLSDTQW